MTAQAVTAAVGIEFLTEQRREPRPVNYRLVPRAEPEAQRPTRIESGGTPPERNGGAATNANLTGTAIGLRRYAVKR